MKINGVQPDVRQDHRLPSEGGGEPPATAQAMPTDRFFMENGARLWPHVYGGPRRMAGSRKMEAGQRLLDLMQKWPPRYRARDAHDLDCWVFAASWADSGYPKLVVSHKYAAALMCTKTVGADVDDVVLPWTTFVIVVPSGLLVDERDGKEVQYDRIRVDMDLETSPCGFLRVYRTDVLSFQLSTLLQGPADLLAPDDADELPDDLDGSQQRIVRLAKRLVAGLLLAVQHTNNFRTTKHQYTGKDADPRQPPEHRVAFVGKPISVDCRPSVRAYVAGRSNGRALPTVQSLVRGHYKRQVIGIGRSGRQVIWIEPYWRGPEDAPILTRPYHVGPRE